MQWMLDNWIWIPLGVEIATMHIFGQRGHVGHGTDGNGAFWTRRRLGSAVRAAGAGRGGRIKERYEPRGEAS